MPQGKKSHKTKPASLLIFIVLTIFIHLTLTNCDKKKNINDTVKDALPTTEYRYKITTEKSGATSYIFEGNEKPKLNLCGNNICDVASVNDALKFLELPSISDGVSDLSSITGARTDRGLYYWENYSLGTLTIERSLCSSGSENFNCIWKVRIKEEPEINRLVPGKEGHGKKSAILGNKTGYTIFFKDGRRLDLDEIWEENNQIKCKIYGTVVGFSRSDISRIEKVGMAK